MTDTSICELHADSLGHPEECTKCDECDHEDIRHVEEYEDPTCWGQSRCMDCVEDAAVARMAREVL